MNRTTIILINRLHNQCNQGLHNLSHSRSLPYLFRVIIVRVDRGDKIVGRWPRKQGESVWRQLVWTLRCAARCSNPGGIWENIINKKPFIWPRLIKYKLAEPEASQISVSQTSVTQSIPTHKGSILRNQQKPKVGKTIGWILANISPRWARASAKYPVNMAEPSKAWLH